MLFARFISPHMNRGRLFTDSLVCYDKISWFLASKVVCFSWFEKLTKRCCVVIEKEVLNEQIRFKTVRRM